MAHIFVEFVIRELILLVLYVHFGWCLTHSRRQILDSSKLKEFTDDNFKFDKNGRKLSKWEENTVGKGEIARYEQFLLFPQCFQKACFPGASNGVIAWEWVNAVLNSISLISWRLVHLFLPSWMLFYQDCLQDWQLSYRYKGVLGHFRLTFNSLPNNKIAVAD